MAKRVVSGEDAEMMVIDIINDIAGEDLAKVLAIVTGEPVRCINDDEFEIG